MRIAIQAKTAQTMNDANEVSQTSSGESAIAQTSFLALTDDEKIDIAAKHILNKYINAFRELANN